MESSDEIAQLPPHERRTLLEHVAGSRVTRVETLEPAAREELQALARRRLAGEPLQHLTGEAYFRYETLAVGPGVFVPRPETEVMTGWVLEQLRAHGPDALVVELCAGSGAISRAIAHEDGRARQYAVELSADALPWLERNLAGTGVDIVAGDMESALHELDGQVDVVVANPPYVPLDEYQGLPVDVRDYDPPLALFSGDDGLDAMRVVARVASRLLRPGGVVAAEHADQQHESAPAIFVAQGFAEVRDHRDLTERWRFTTARWPSVQK